MALPNLVPRENNNGQTLGTEEKQWTKIYAKGLNIDGQDVKLVKDSYIDVTKEGVSTVNSEEVNTAAFATAIKKAVAEHKALYIPAGTYNASLLVTLDNIFGSSLDDRDLYLDIFGDGLRTVISGSDELIKVSGRIVTKKDSNGNDTTENKILRFVRIHDLWLTGKDRYRQANTAINVIDAQYVDVYDVHITDVKYGLKLEGSMDMNCQNLNIVGVGDNGVTDCCGIYASSFSAGSISSNANKFVNIHIENTPKAIYIGGGCYGFMFSNFKLETARTLTSSSPVEIYQAKGIEFCNGMVTYSESHSQGDASEAYNVSSSGLTFFDIKDQATNNPYEFFSGNRTLINGVQFNCPPGYKANWIKAYNTTIVNCAFNACDCTGSYAFQLLGNCLMKDCYINNKSMPNNNSNKIISKTATDIVCDNLLKVGGDTYSYRTYTPTAGDNVDSIAGSVISYGKLVVYSLMIHTNAQISAQNTVLVKNMPVPLAKSEDTVLTSPYATAVGGTDTNASRAFRCRVSSAGDIVNLTTSVQANYYIINGCYIMA